MIPYAFCKQSIYRNYTHLWISLNSPKCCCRRTTSMPPQKRIIWCNDEFISCTTHIQHLNSFLNWRWTINVHSQFCMRFLVVFVFSVCNMSIETISFVCFTAASLERSARFVVRFWGPGVRVCWSKSGRALIQSLDNQSDKNQDAFQKRADVAKIKWCKYIRMIHIMRLTVKL